VDEGSAARVFELGELGVEDAWPLAECPGGLVDAVVLGDHEQAVEAWPRAAAGQGVTQWFGQVAGMAAGCRAGGDEYRAAAGADRDAVLAGEPVQGLDGAADLVGYVVEGPVPGEVFLAEPGRVEVEDPGLLAGGRAGGRGPGDEGSPDRVLWAGQRVVAQDLAQVAEGDAEAGCDLGGRGVLVEQGVVDGGGVGVCGVCSGPGDGGNPAGRRLPFEGLAIDPAAFEQAAGVVVQRAGQAGRPGSGGIGGRCGCGGSQPVRLTRSCAGFTVIMFPGGLGHDVGAWALRVLVSIPAGAWGAGVRMTRREMMSPASTTAAPTSKAVV
jgi:hypothetical protein